MEKCALLGDIYVMSKKSMSYHIMELYVMTIVASLFEKHLCNQSIATVKNTDDFCYENKPSRATTKSAIFAVSKDEWNTKEDTGKSKKNALYVLRYAKRHLSGRNNCIVVTD